MIRPVHIDRTIRFAGLCGISLVAGWMMIVGFLLACGEDLADAICPVSTWRIQRHVDPNNPLIQSWAADVRTVTSIDIEQAAIAEQAIWHLVRYWDAYETWGNNHCIPSVEQIIGRAGEEGWPTLRGNCVSPAIMLCSLLRALGHEARIRTTTQHAWVECKIGTRTLDFLRPASGQTVRNLDLSALALPRAGVVAACRLGANLEGNFDAIELLPERNQPIPYFGHPGLLFLMVPLAIAWIRIFLFWDHVSSRLRFGSATGWHVVVLNYSTGAIVQLRRLVGYGLGAIIRSPVEDQVVRVRTTSTSVIRQRADL